MNEHPARDPSQKGDSSLGPENTAEAVSGGAYSAPAKSGSSLSAKFRRQKAKVVTALKSLTNSSSEQLVVVEQPGPPADEHEPKSTLISGIHKMSNAIFRPPLEPTVVRRTSPKSRPLVKETFRGAETSPESTSGSSPTHTTASNTSSSKTSASNSNSGKPAQKASVESTFKTQDPNTVGREGNRPRNRTPRPDPQGRATPPSTPRRTNIHHPPSTPPRATATRPSTPKTSNNKRPTPINPISHLLHPYRLPTPAPTPTKAPATIHPPPPTSPLTPTRTFTPTPTPTSTLTPIASIATAERAAAAKIFLETHFGKLLGPGPSPRQMRQQMLETELFNRNRVGGNGGGNGGNSGGNGGAAAAAAAAAAARVRFWRRESEYLREMRVVKVRGLGLVGVGCGTGTGSGSGSGLGGEGESGNGNGVGEEGKGGKGGMDGGGLSGYRGYETVSVLGKGSFGVVRLVRERGRAGRVYAMKVIRKSKMLRTSQEGHLRAERDILVASEGSRWIVPLVASFQDLTNLYLVMEYMPGGDFLSLLIRENILHESVARFYVAEIILCVEAAHSLKCIHRDIKPDNFLVSASGHLKISDFGLAFDGHWSHDATYYNSHRSEDRDPETDKRSSGITAAIARHDRKIEQNGEPLLSWRNRCGIRYAARSVVGTSQYMAPEWSVGVILFECIYGHTPFLSEEGRRQTKDNIIRHHETFGFPPRPTVSRRCQHLMLSLIADKEYRLCSERYRMKDLITSSSSSSSSGPSSKIRDFAGRYVFPYDAEDIKAHKWFRHIPWERLHELEPPLIPKLRSVDDTHYFEDGGSVSDGSESAAADEDIPVNDAHDGAAEHSPNMLFPPPACPMPGWSPAACFQTPLAHAHPYPDHGGGAGYLQSYSPHATSDTNCYSPTATPLQLLPSLESVATPTHFPPSIPTATPAFAHQEEQLAYLRPLRYPLQSLALAVLSTPPPPPPHHAGVDTKMRMLEAYLAQMTLADATEAERTYLRGFVGRFGGAAGGGGEGVGDGEGKGGQRERRRPRDKLLRDRRTCAVAMEVRRRTAFLGYEWTRMRGEDDGDDGGEDRKGGGGGVGGEVGAGGVVGLDGEHGGRGDGENRAGDGGYKGSGAQAHGEQQQEKQHLRGGFRPWGDDVAVVRAMYSGPWSLR
ncbi:hypothetical protein F5144DRAFT_626081 [Chaetomium tenue]|uniref:Uncharacterized protein n=1 Tax=Chaetomium tenue TaxID=1854479 RepID=A0ACB7PQQ2_9PEZI|nr:hypothetical protein F5144DRAFT_626081 [Chaetomium globosum]